MGKWDSQYLSRCRACQWAIRRWQTTSLQTESLFPAQMGYEWLVEQEKAESETTQRIWVCACDNDSRVGYPVFVQDSLSLFSISLSLSLLIDTGLNISHDRTCFDQNTANSWIREHTALWARTPRIYFFIRWRQSCCLRHAELSDNASSLPQPTSKTKLSGEEHRGSGAICFTSDTGNSSRDYTVIWLQTHT